ncbi:MAG: hypothetical protein CO163_09720, partial [Rhodobacterales bacterium CG_4_9_14_3_um_filter_71_31]
MTSGVPSSSAAQVRPDSSGPICARIWRDTVTSRGAVSPANGVSGAKARTCCGSPQAIAPPTARPPARSRTGNSGSSAVWPPVSASAPRA